MCEIRRYDYDHGKQLPYAGTNRGKSWCVNLRRLPHPKRISGQNGVMGKVCAALGVKCEDVLDYERMERYRKEQAEKNVK